MSGAAASAALALALAPALSLSANNPLYGAAGIRSSARPDLAPRDAYRARAIPGFSYYRSVEAELARETRSPGARPRVLLFSECLGALLPSSDWVCGSPVDQGVAAYDDPRGAEAALRRLGATHVSVDWDSPDLGVFGRGAVESLRAVLRRRGRAVVADGPRVLYRLEPDAGPPGP